MSLISRFQIPTKAPFPCHPNAFRLGSGEALLLRQTMGRKLILAAQNCGRNFSPESFDFYGEQIVV